FYGWETGRGPGTSSGLGRRGLGGPVRLGIGGPFDQPVPRTDQLVRDGLFGGGAGLAQYSGTFLRPPVPRDGFGQCTGERCAVCGPGFGTERSAQDVGGFVGPVLQKQDPQITRYATFRRCARAPFAQGPLEKEAGCAGILLPHGLPSGSA